MSLFRHRDLGDLQREVGTRLQTAETVWNDTFRDDVSHHVGRIDEASWWARKDLSSFSAEFGEPMPSHLANAMRLEIELWGVLMSAAKNGEAERSRACAAILRDLLRQEVVMLSTCLTNKFPPMIAELRSRAARLPQATKNN